MRRLDSVTGIREEGFYRHGDVAASPAAHAGVFAQAVDRNDISIMLTTLPDGEVADMATTLGLPAGVSAKAGGAINDGLSSLLTAMYGVYRKTLAHG